MSERCKITGDEPATGFAYGETPAVPGLTIRQHYAGLAMQGILNSIPLKLQDMEALLKYYAKQYPGMSMFECVAAESVGQADALIEALNK